MNKILLAILLAFSLAACGGGDGVTKPDDGKHDDNKHDDNKDDVIPEFKFPEANTEDVIKPGGVIMEFKYGLYNSDPKAKPSNSYGQKAWNEDALYLDVGFLGDADDKGRFNIIGIRLVKETKPDKTGWQGDWKYYDSGAFKAKIAGPEHEVPADMFCYKLNTANVESTRAEFYKFTQIPTTKLLIYGFGSSAYANTNMNCTRKYNFKKNTFLHDVMPYRSISTNIWKDKDRTKIKTITIDQDVINGVENSTTKTAYANNTQQNIITYNLNLADIKAIDVLGSIDGVLGTNEEYSCHKKYIKSKTPILDPDNPMGGANIIGYDHVWLDCPNKGWMDKTKQSRIEAFVNQYVTEDRFKQWLEVVDKDLKVDK